MYLTLKPPYKVEGHIGNLPEVLGGKNILSCTVLFNFISQSHLLLVGGRATVPPHPLKVTGPNLT